MRKRLHEPTIAMSVQAPMAFIELARSRGLTPAQVLEAFMADLAGTDRSNGSDERDHAEAWFDRVVWPETEAR